MNDDPGRPPYGSALIVSGVIFLLYVVTLAPTTAFWDASEYIATAYILGIPHPPGNPLFVTMAKVWTLLLEPTGLPIAARVNLFAAFTSALASGFLFLVAQRVLAGVVQKDWVATAGAAAAAVIGGTAFTVWNQSTVNEKVYTLSVLVIAAVSWLAVRWLDRRHEPGSERLLLAAGYMIVLGNSNHLMSVLPAGSLLLVVLLAKPGALLGKRLWIRAVPLILLGLSFNLVLPVRAAERPAINEGDPLCESVASAALSAATLGKAGCAELGSVLQREQYAKPPVTERMAPLSHQLLNWFQYFDWQWARSADPSEVPGNARLPFSLLFGLLGLVGLLAAFEADKRIFAYLGSLTFVLTMGLVFYLNFKFGYSLAPEVVNRDLHEVRERDYFFIAGFLLWGVLAGIGLTWAWDKVASAMTSARAHLLTAPVLLVGLIPLYMNGSWASRSGDYAARSWAYDLLMSVEPYGVIFTNGDNDTFPLWYLQEVEGIRQDVTVIVGMYLNTLWYPKQLQELTTPGSQRPFDVELAGDLYPDATEPTHAVLRSTPEQMDAVGTARLDRDVVVPFPDLAISYPAGTVLDRVQRMALSIIHDSIDERPIYFATSGGLMQQLGLDQFSVRQGLVSKLVLRPLDEPQPAGLVLGSPEMGAEWFDYERSMTLYDEVYDFRGLEQRAIWSDRATLNIPWHFYALAIQLSDVAEKQGVAATRVQALQSDAAGFLVTAEGGFLGRPGVLN
jgi:hypothetical protein